MDINGIILLQLYVNAKKNVCRQIIAQESIMKEEEISNMHAIMFKFSEKSE
jgi:hypothetical protein